MSWRSSCGPARVTCSHASSPPSLAACSPHLTSTAAAWQRRSGKQTYRTNVGFNSDVSYECLHLFQTGRASCDAGGRGCLHLF